MQCFFLGYAIDGWTLISVGDLEKNGLRRSKPRAASELSVPAYEILPKRYRIYSYAPFTHKVGWSLRPKRKADIRDEFVNV